jgi:hypothetical protein
VLNFDVPGAGKLEGANPSAFFLPFFLVHGFAFSETMESVADHSAGSAVDSVFWVCW